jgi:hypothetical protein
MMIYDLLFLAVVLISVVSLISAAILAVSGRGGRVLRLLKWWGIGAAVYIAAAAAVAMALPLEVFHVGDIQCEDDWCLNVESAQRVSADRYEVVLRMINQAQRVAQRNNNGLLVYLTDDHGTRYPSLPAPDVPAFNVLLQPGESVPTVRRFNVPQDAKHLGLIVGHERWLPIPILGREPFQKTVVLLDARP